MQINPFHVSPNPLSIHRTASLTAAIAKTEYVLQNGLGLTAVVADYGLGKSMLCRFIHQTFDADERYSVVLISTPVFPSEFALVKAICAELDLPARRSLTAQLETLRAFLVENYQANRRTILLIDEANKLKSRDLEILRAVLNYETFEEKLISIALFGSLQLRRLILEDENKPLYSRIAAPSTLDTMTPEDVAGLIHARQSFYQCQFPFTPDALGKLWAASNGVPRRALLIAGLAVKLYEMQGAKEITPDLIADAAAESSLEE